MVIRNAMPVDPTGPGEEGTSYLERSPALFRVLNYRTGNRAGWGPEKSAEAMVCAEQRVDREGSSPSGARMRSAVSKSGGNASLAGKSGRYGEA